MEVIDGHVTLTSEDRVLEMVGRHAPISRERFMALCRRIGPAATINPLLRSLESRNLIQQWQVINRNPRRNRAKWFLDITVTGKHVMLHW